jgi:hypothetical protein
MTRLNPMLLLALPANDDPPALAAAIRSRSGALRNIIGDTRWSAGIRHVAVVELVKLNRRLDDLSAECRAFEAGLRRRLVRQGVRPKTVEA